MERTIFHIDVNNAFLSWSAIEILKDDDSVDLRAIPSAIGGDSATRQGIILAKSILAKKYGVSTGEPIVSALRKCPHLRIVPPNYNLYHKNSNLLFEYLLTYSDRIEIFSIDECFVDYTGMERLFGEPKSAAYTIKNEIENQFGFTVNVGVGPNKLLAKMAGELEKPNKVITLFHHELKEKFWPLPVSELFMVGRNTAPRLNKMGIFTIGQLANYDYKTLEYEFKSYAKLMKEYANGIDNTPVSSCESIHTYKSISNATTTPKDILKAENAYPVLLALSQNVSQRLRKHGMYANGISVMLKTNEFETYSHQKKLENAVDDTTSIYNMAVEIFNHMWKKEPLRLLSVSADKLTKEKVTQFVLEDYDSGKQRQAELAMDIVNRKYGKNKVTRGTLITKDLKIGEGSTFSKDVQ